MVSAEPFANEFNRLGGIAQGELLVAPERASRRFVPAARAHLFTRPALCVILGFKMYSRQIAVKEPQLQLDGVNTFRNPPEINLRSRYHLQKATAISLVELDPLFDRRDPELDARIHSRATSCTHCTNDLPLKIAVSIGSRSRTPSRAGSPCWAQCFWRLFFSTFLIRSLCDEASESLSWEHAEEGATGRLFCFGGGQNKAGRALSFIAVGYPAWPFSVGFAALPKRQTAIA
jgi:hypothetical protein